MEVPVHLTVEEAVKQELSKRAETCKMTFSDYVRNVFNDHIKNKVGFVVMAE